MDVNKQVVDIITGFSEMVAYKVAKNLVEMDLLKEKAPVTCKKRTSPPVEETAAPETKAPETLASSAEPAVDFVKVRTNAVKMILDIVKMKGRSEAVDLLTVYEAKNVKEVADDRLEAFVAAATDILDGEVLV